MYKNGKPINSAMAKNFKKTSGEKKILIMSMWPVSINKSNRITIVEAVADNVTAIK